MNAFEHFFLKIPYVLLEMISYFWFLIVIFFTWPPVFSGILSVCLLLSLVIIAAQGWIWEASIQRDCRARGVQSYINRPRMPLLIQARNLVLVIFGGILVGFLLEGKVGGLTGLQWFLLVVGIFLLQKDIRLLGAATVYYVTDEGIWLGYVNLSLFFRFSEIQKVVSVREVGQRPENWEMFTPTNHPREGILLVPTNAGGFMRMIKEIFLSPTDMNDFLRHLPRRLVIG